MKTFIEYQNEEVQTYGFQITQFVSELLANGWVRTRIDWKANKENHLFKYVSEGFSSICGNNRSQELRFEEVKHTCRGFDTCFSIMVGIQSNRNSKYLEPKYFRNLKYGVEVMFGPRDFENQKVTKPIKTQINKI